MAQICNVEMNTGNIEIVRLLLMIDKTDVNVLIKYKF